MRNPRVLVLNHFAAPRGEAGGTRHVELFDRLEGWDHLIIASNLNPQTGRHVASEIGFVTVPVYSYSHNGSARILNWLSYTVTATLKGLQVGPVDVVYGSSPHLLAAFAAWQLSVVKRAKFVLEIRDLWPKVLVDMGHLGPRSITYKALTALEEFLYRRADAVVVLAEGTRTDLLVRGIPGGKIHYVPNGADPEDFVPSASRHQLRQRYNFTRTTAVYAGAHGPANGLQLLLEAAALNPSVDVVLVGGGVLKNQLREEAQTRNLVNVRFLDPIPKSDIPDLMAAADVGLHVLADVELFRTAVSPNKIFDYMAAALPILTNCPGVVGELVVTAGAGIVTAPTQIAFGLRRMDKMTESARRQLGIRGREWVGRQQSRRRMAKKLGAVLSGVVAHDGSVVP